MCILRCQTASLPSSYFSKQCALKFCSQLYSCLLQLTADVTHLNIYSVKVTHLNIKSVKLNLILSRMKEHNKILKHSDSKWIRIVHETLLCDAFQVENNYEFLMKSHLHSTVWSTK